METLLPHYLAYWQPLGYIILFLGMMVEGDTVLFVAAYLTHAGYFALTPMLLTALWGMILGDNLWYTLGLKLRKSERLQFIAKWAEGLAQPFDEHLRENPFRTIFIAKFTYGFNRAVITRAGMLNLRWKKIEESDILATLLWMAIVGGLGYFSSASLSYLKSYIRYGEVGLLIAVVLFFLLERALANHSRKHL